MKHSYPPFKREYPQVAEQTLTRGPTWLTGGPETIDDGNPKKAPLLKKEKSENE